MQLYRGPTNVVLQIARKFLIYTSIPTLCSKFVLSQKTIECCETVLQKKNFVHFIRCREEIILLGKDETCSLLVEEEQLLTINGVSTENCLAYRRMIYKQIRYTCNRYCNNKLNNDSYISINSGEKVVILKFSVGIKLIAQQLNIRNKSVVRSKDIKHTQKIDS